MPGFVLQAAPVPADPPPVVRVGFTVSKKLAKTGWWASDTAELSFDGCRVPVANLIGDENAGFVPIMMNFVGERLFLAGNCVSIAELAYYRSRLKLGR